MTTRSDASEQSLERARQYFPKGSTVFCVLRHLSRSGMQREIGLVVFRDGYDFHPNWCAAGVLGARLGRDGIVVNGCGMDMGGHLVSRLAYVLWGDDQALRHRWL